MRMWCVSPTNMCDQHLLGEHVELHMFVGTILKSKSLQGYIDGKLVDVSKIESRHSELVSEMESRGIRHKSPLPEFEWSGPIGGVDVAANEKELSRRCAFCRFNKE